MIVEFINMLKLDGMIMLVMMITVVALFASITALFKLNIIESASMYLLILAVVHFSAGDSLYPWLEEFGSDETFNQMFAWLSTLLVFIAVLVISLYFRMRKNYVQNELDDS